ncbi:hypothetical protein [Reovirus GCRV104]|nr:hypothetical protein [Reovirus GCRV104]
MAQSGFNLPVSSVTKATRSARICRDFPILSVLVESDPKDVLNTKCRFPNLRKSTELMFPMKAMQYERLTPRSERHSESQLQHVGAQMHMLATHPESTYPLSTSLSAELKTLLSPHMPAQLVELVCPDHGTIPIVAAKQLSAYLAGVELYPNMGNTPSGIAAALCYHGTYQVLTSNDTTSFVPGPLPGNIHHSIRDFTRLAPCIEISFGVKTDSQYADKSTNVMRLDHLMAKYGADAAVFKIILLLTAMQLDLDLHQRVPQTDTDQVRRTYGVARNLLNSVGPICMTSEVLAKWLVIASTSDASSLYDLKMAYEQARNSTLPVTMEPELDRKRELTGNLVVTHDGAWVLVRPLRQ